MTLVGRGNGGAMGEHTWAFLQLQRAGLLSSCRLLIAVASAVAEHRLWGKQASGVAAPGL